MKDLYSIKKAESIGSVADVDGVLWCLGRRNTERGSRGIAAVDRASGAAETLRSQDDLQGHGIGGPGKTQS